MRWAKDSGNPGLPIQFFIVLGKDSEKYYFTPTSDAEITNADFGEAITKVKKQCGYLLGWTNAHPSWLDDRGYKCLD